MKKVLAAVVCAALVPSLQSTPAIANPNVLIGWYCTGKVTRGASSGEYKLQIQSTLGEAIVGRMVWDGNSGSDRTFNGIVSQDSIAFQDGNSQWTLTVRSDGSLDAVRDLKTSSSPLRFVFKKATGTTC